MRRRYWTLGVGLMVVSASCSSGSGTGTGGAPISLEELRDRYLDALCGGTANCCAAQGLTQDENKCRAALGGFLNLSLSQVDAGKVIYNASAAGSCIQTIESAAAACSLDMAGANDQCDQVFQGTVAIGEPCASDGECAGTDAECSDDVCVESRRGVAGDNCLGTCKELGGGSSSCSLSGMREGNTITLCWTNDGVYCNADDQCAPLVKIGESGCSGSSQACPDSAFCEADTCVPRRGVGGQCTSSSQCVEDSYCDTAAMQCSAAKPIGATCESFDECGVNDCDSGKCVQDRSSFSGFVCAGN